MLVIIPSTIKKIYLSCEKLFGSRGTLPLQYLYNYSCMCVDFHITIKGNTKIERLEKNMKRKVVLITKIYKWSHEQKKIIYDEIKLGRI